MSKLITTPEGLIKKQGQAWEDANCGELWEVAAKLYAEIIKNLVPSERHLDAVKIMLSILERSSGCTGLVWT